MKKIALISIFFFSAFTSVAQSGEEFIQYVIDGNLQKVKSYLDAGGNVNYVDYYGFTALIYASEKGDTLILPLLIKYGADINYLPRYSPSALGYCVLNGNISALEILLRAGADPDLTDNLGYTPLAYAVYYGYYDAADILLYYGASPVKRVKDWSPLELAVANDDTVLVKMLLYYGADIYDYDHEGNTVLHTASAVNASQSLSVLVDKGIDLNIKNNDGATALAIATYAFSDNAGKILLANGANTTAKVNDYTPYQIAILRQNYKFRKMLKYFPGNEPLWGVNYFIDTRSFVWYDDLLLSAQIGIKGLYSNIEWYSGIYVRPFEKRVIIRQTEHLYYQYWEKSTGIYTGIKKNFYLYQKKSNLFLFSPEFMAGYGLLSYSGLAQKNFVPFVSPGIGFTYVHDSFRLGLGVNYMSLNPDMYSAFKFSVSLGYRLNNIKLDMKVKNKAPFENEALF